MPASPSRPALLLPLALGLLAAGLAPAARAQQTPPQPPAGERLPSLTPREFVIPGEATVDLPQIERQPLSGFGPPPRTYVVPAERQPVVQPYDPPLDGLPPFGLGAPAEPDADLPPGRRGRVEGGAGSFLARYGRFDLSLPVAAGLLFADVDYDGIGSGGDRYVPFDRLTGVAGVQTYGPVRFRLEGQALRDGYGLPALSPDFRRVRSRYGAEGSLEGVGSVPFALSLGYGYSRIDVGEFLDEPDLGRGAEGRLAATARLGLLGNRIRVDALGGTAGLDGGVGGDERHGAAGAQFAVGRPDGVRFVLGARAMGYRTSEANGDGRGQAAGPILDLGLPLGPLRAFARNEPRLLARSLSDLYGENPFASPEALVAPDLRPVDAEAGVEIGRGALRARAFATYTHATTQLHFQTAPGGLFSAVYAGTRTAGLAADLALTLPGGASASAAFAVRDGALTGGGGTLPFFAPVAGRVGVQVPFARGRGRVGLAGYAEGERPTDPSGTLTAPGWGQLAFDGRYAITRPLALVLRAERLLGTAERWPGYAYAPYTVLGGLRLGW